MDKNLESILNVTNEILDSIDLESYRGMSATMGSPKDFFYMKSGQEHYRLLAYISTLFNGETLLDIGTYQGSSSIALGHNDNNKVVSFDIQAQPEIDLISKKNIEYRLCNALECLEIIEKSKAIMLDTYHDGTYENEFYSQLNSMNYKGILLLDDIFLNDPMKNFWNSIDREKYNITNIGHYTGTGLVYFK